MLEVNPVITNQTVNAINMKNSLPCRVVLKVPLIAHLAVYAQWRCGHQHTRSQDLPLYRLEQMTILRIDRKYYLVVNEIRHFHM